MVNNHLVGGWPSPLKNMSSSVGMVKKSVGIMIIPNIWGKNVPNHQPDIDEDWFDLNVWYLLISGHDQRSNLEGSYFQMNPCDIVTDKTSE